MTVLIRKTCRGEVNVDGCTYFACELADFHQQEVFVEPTTDDKVKVFDMSGKLICTAMREMYKVATFQKNASSVAQYADKLLGNILQTEDLDDLGKPIPQNHEYQATIPEQARKRSTLAKVARKKAMIESVLARQSN